MLYFFLSYARGDEDDLVRQFYSDLSVEVRVRAGLPKDAEVGFIDARMKAGTPWSNQLADALSQTRSFIALMSPRYFLSKPCGQEWQIFADRARRYRDDTGTDPAALKPLVWVPVSPAKMHPVAARIQHSSDLLGDNCVRQLMRLHRHQDTYREFVFELAGQIVDCAEAHELPEGHRYTDIETVPSVFHTPPAGHSEIDGAQTDFPVDAMTVHFVVAALTRDSALRVRADREMYGDRASDWAPYRPSLPSPLSEYASSVAASKRFASRIADLEELAERAEQASRHNQIIVLLVDAWVSEVEPATRLLSSYNEREVRDREPTTAVLIPRSQDDRETMQHWRGLSEACRRIFRGTADDDELYRSGILTYQAFEQELPQVLEVAANRMFASGHIHRRPPGEDGGDRPMLDAP